MFHFNLIILLEQFLQRKFSVFYVFSNTDCITILQILCKVIFNIAYDFHYADCHAIDFVAWLIYIYCAKTYHDLFVWYIWETVISVTNLDYSFPSKNTLQVLPVILVISTKFQVIHSVLWTTSDCGVDMNLSVVLHEHKSLKLTHRKWMLQWILDFESDCLGFTFLPHHLLLL